MEYYQYLFEDISADQKDILVAMLNSIGFTGFEEDIDTLKAFISKADFDHDQFEDMVAITAVKYSRSIIEEINWNEEWEKSFEPVAVFYPGTVNPFVHLRAAFHKVDENAKFDILITPKMSFGTGHHATTYLMIEQMSEIDLRDKTVIDFGTGTGVLAILAEKLGAKKVIAIDNDDWSINNVMENIAANNCEKISLVKAETIASSEKAAVILANINLNIIVNSLPAIKNAAQPAASILFSGVMMHDEPVILAALHESEINVKKVLHKNGWLAILAEI